MLSEKEDLCEPRKRECESPGKCWSFGQRTQLAKVFKIYDQWSQPYIIVVYVPCPSECGALVYV